MTGDRLLGVLRTDLGPVELYDLDGVYASRREFVRADTGSVACSVIPLDEVSARCLYAECRRRGAVYGELSRPQDVHPSTLTQEAP